MSSILECSVCRAKFVGSKSLDSCAFHVNPAVHFLLKVPCVSDSCNDRPLKMYEFPICLPGQAGFLKPLYFEDTLYEVRDVEIVQKR